MQLIQHQLKIDTPGRKIISITAQVIELITGTKITTGLCHLFLQHTSASLILCENADPLVHLDLETFMHRLVPDDDPDFRHIAEGPDDMPSHVRSILTQNSLTIPIMNHKLALGIWQGIYVWEHRLMPHQRNLVVTMQGE